MASQQSLQLFLETIHSQKGRGNTWMVGVTLILYTQVYKRHMKEDYENKEWIFEKLKITI